MKFAIFFLLLLFLQGFTILTSESNYVFLLIWTAISSLLLFVAYAKNKPYLVMGKRANGSVNIILTLINAPWIVFTRYIFTIQRNLSNEDPVNQIHGTPFSISRFPIDINTSGYDMIIDLTCEFISPDRHKRGYLCLSNLDGMKISNFDLPHTITSAKSILIHCAQGHGRSATFTALLMHKFGYAKSTTDALSIIQNARPAAKINLNQLQQLKIATNQSLHRSP